MKYLCSAHTLSRCLALLFALTVCSTSISQTIVFPSKGSDLERLAAKEVRRYLYLRTGQLLRVEGVCSLPTDGDLILVAKDTEPLINTVTSLSAPCGGFFIKSITRNGRTILTISGDDDTTTLQGAYRLAEKLGCRFYLHGDVVPDRRVPLKLSGYDEQGQPLTRESRQFVVRGVQPFQNFPPGAVMWGTDDWKMYVSQLPKMGMNFLGLHTYMYTPEDDHVGDYGPTLNLWMGHERDLNPDGTVKFAFDATFFHSHQSIIGWGKTNTSELAGGASQLFATDGYPPGVIGESYHHDQKGFTSSFNRAADLFRDVFTLARQLGIRTATGVEIPIGRDGETSEGPFVSGIPKILQERLRTTYGLDPLSDEASSELYRGMYLWLVRNQIPVDYFWLWTAETWMPWGDASLDRTRVQLAKSNIQTAVAVYESMSPKPFEEFATCGWILGAQDDPDVFGDVLPSLKTPFSYMNPPFDKDGDDMPTKKWLSMIPENRIKWPFTWMEYDYALEQPSFHMYRVLEDAWNAYEQRADGLIGEFWRTKMIAPMFAAFKDVTWDYSSTSKAIIHNLPADHESRHERIDDIYVDWAVHEFGPGPTARWIAELLAEFEKRDVRRFRNVTDFLEGADNIYSQGYITGGDWGSNHRWGPWQEEQVHLDWVNQWDVLREQISGAGNLARYDYWRHVFKSYKLMAEFACELNRYEETTTSGDLEAAAGHRGRLARLWELIMSTLVQRIHDEVDLGVILNLHWRTWRNWVEGHYDAEFLDAGGKLPENMDPSSEYSGGKFIICMPLLTRVCPNEPVSIKALMMGNVTKPTLHFRTLGSMSFQHISMELDARGVYRVRIPGQRDDFEWYVTANTSLGDVIFPATAGALPKQRMYQTVVVAPLGTPPTN